MLVVLEAAKGKTDKEIAADLYRSYWTVRTQRKTIYDKLGIRKDTELLWWLICKKLRIEFNLNNIRTKGIEVLDDGKL